MLINAVRYTPRSTQKTDWSHVAMMIGLGLLYVAFIEGIIYLVTGQFWHPF